ncbi:hypothetical protein ATO49_08630 [Mycolicibacterium fortuitum subsp. fortuitum DSM 46621 = ATCC 6841 = JCM 6387]|nr:hypothetical protein ATO49_08630 [Mycolicibacterium fortuitum subsp. fortuitum DSM 46621 = ATCC 6841 = JCM 6387]
MRLRRSVVGGPGLRRVRRGRGFGYLDQDGVAAVLGLYGVFIDRESAANFIPVNVADNWLHFGLALTMIALGLVFGRTATAASGIDTGAPGTIE